MWRRSRMEFRQMRKPKSNPPAKAEGSKGMWSVVAADAQAEIGRARERIQRLEGIIRFCQRMDAAGESFPVDVVLEP